MGDEPLVRNEGRDCSSCEFFDRQRRPNDGVFAGPKPYCAGLGFFLLSTSAAIDCKLYTARRAVNSRSVP